MTYETHQEVSGHHIDVGVGLGGVEILAGPDIIEDIKIGINKTDGKYIVIPNRKEAIKYCIENSKNYNSVSKISIMQKPTSRA